ncbi:uncharacterized protein LOC105801206 [Gossypium raimondii]|uniref:uncharacterized protein LOC105801206 n=1 Tax=Gossypium raimondii TaxID=29730 RepID=UPI00063B04A3|nr:uncharacterized protein LOC105801206 [Gossypium raimondii]
MVAFEYKQCVYFEDGFRDNLRVLIAPQRERDLSALVEKAKIIEEDIEVVMIGERRNYLSNVIFALVVEKNSTVKDIRTVKDVSGVFPDELSSLPLNREVEFGIELLPGTAPVSIAPYRMALKELVELQAQIQELLDPPLTKLLRKGVPFNWIDAQQESFEKLKTILTDAPDGKVVAYASPLLKTHEANYLTHDLELDAVKEFNFRQRRRIELLKDYDYTNKYHLGKANVEVDALSYRAMIDLRAIFVRLSLFDDGSLLADLQDESGNTEDFGLNSEGDEAKHQLPSSLLQLVKIPLWKWECVTMDFVNGLPLTPTNEDSIWVIVDRLTKSAHSIPVRTDYSLHKLAKLYISEIKTAWRPVAYQLELPPELNQIHDVFHISMLRRYFSDPWYIILVEEIEVRPNLTFEEEPVQILDRDVMVLKRKSIPLVKVLWSNQNTKEAT